MTATVRLSPNVYSPNGTEWSYSGGSDRLVVVDQDPDSDNLITYIGQTAMGNGTTYEARYDMDDVPGDFLAAVSAELRVKIFISGWVDDTSSLRFRLVDVGTGAIWMEYAILSQNVADGTVLAYAPALTADALFATAANWNNLRLDVVGTKTTSMSSDTINMRIYSFEVNLTYYTTNEFPRPAIRAGTGGSGAAANANLQSAVNFSIPSHAVDDIIVVRGFVTNPTVSGDLQMPDLPAGGWELLASKGTWAAADSTGDIEHLSFAYWLRAIQTSHDMTLVPHASWTSAGWWSAMAFVIRYAKKTGAPFEGLAWGANNYDNSLHPLPILDVTDTNRLGVMTYQGAGTAQGTVPSGYTQMSITSAGGIAHQIWKINLDADKASVNMNGGTSYGAPLGMAFLPMSLDLAFPKSIIQNQAVRRAANW